MHLAQADLARPHGGAGRGQIHEVEAGDQQDQHADDGNAIEGRPASGRLHAAIAVGGQMHVAEGRQVTC